MGRNDFFRDDPRRRTMTPGQRFIDTILVVQGAILALLMMVGLAFAFVYGARGVVSDIVRFVSPG